MIGLRFTIPALVAFVAASAGATAQDVTMPSPPKISLSDGTELVSLARSAMHRYIRRRTPSGAQAIPPRLKRLVERPYAAAVTLRRDGRKVAQSVHSGHGLPTNVIAAALKAMRSPKLPDRVTQKLLDSMTIEVEVFGGPRPVGEKDLANAVVPGAVGVMLTRGTRTAYSLPSSAVILGLGADQCRTNCLTQLGLHRAGAAMPPRWAVFAAQHYVGYPNGRILRLVRGKILVPPRAIDEKTLADAAEIVAAYLIAAQAQDGQYRPAINQLAAPGDHTPHGAVTGHLYATFAMARLARNARAQTRPVLGASVDRALDWAIARLRHADDDGPTYVAAKDPRDRLPATAMLALALGQVQPTEKRTRLRKQLHATLKASVARAFVDSARPGPTAAPQSRPSRTAPDAARAKDAAIAVMALARAAEKDKKEAENLLTLKQALTARVLARKLPADAATTLWWARAGLAQDYRTSPRRPPAMIFPQPAANPNPDLPDEAGGYGDPHRAPTTVVTALMAVQLADRIAKAKRRTTTVPVTRLRRDLLAARRFCYQMMYRPNEAYFTPKPRTWVGAIRDSPASAHVCLHACAAAIEAFLAK